MIARATANEVNASYFKSSCAELTSKWVGGSEKLIRSLFVSARKVTQSIIFLDEIDSIAGSRGSDKTTADQRLTNQLLVEMDTNTNEEKNIIVIAATNLPWAIDIAVIRRFPKRVYIPLPDSHARLKMVTNQNQSSLLLLESDIDYIVENSEGLSGSDIKSLLNDICMESIRILQKTKSFCINTRVDESNTTSNSVYILESEHTTNENCRIIHDTTLDDIIREYSEDEIMIPRVSIDFIQCAMQKIKPTVHKEYLTQYKDFV